MPQNEHIELHRKRHGRRFDHYEKLKKKEGRLPIFFQRKLKHYVESKPKYTTNVVPMKKFK